jgi:arylsulfatase A-like enzyme
MRRSNQQGKPFYLYLPYTQTHIPTTPDPEYAGKTKRGNWADILTQMDDFTGQILDELDTLGVADRHDRRVGLRQRRRFNLPGARW